MKSSLLPMILAGALCLAGCSAPSASATSTEVPACICGTHEARIHGCHHPDCVSGAGNAANPDCHCAPLVPVNPPKKGP